MGIQREYIGIWLIEGSLEQTSDKMDRWKAEMGRVREEKRRRKEIKEATLVGYFSNYLNILLSMLKGTNQWKKIVVVGRYVRFTMNNSSTFKDFYPLHPSLCLTITAWSSIGDAPTQRAEPSRDHAWVSTWGPTLVGMLPVAVMAYMADMATKNRNMSSGTSSIYNSDIHRLTQWFLGHVFHYPQTKGLFLYEQIQHRQKNIPAPCAVVFCPRARREIGWSPWRNFCWTLIPSFARCTCRCPSCGLGLQESPEPLDKDHIANWFWKKSVKRGWNISRSVDFLGRDDGFVGFLGSFCYHRRSGSRLEPILRPSKISWKCFIVN